tara:strand:+ start:270 stop:431 length:162 start_codon:yes stop_codon:yes gene_type:complete
MMHIIIGRVANCKRYNTNDKMIDKNRPKNDRQKEVTVHSMIDIFPFFSPEKIY